MSDDDETDEHDIVELTRLQPIEAEVVVAELRSNGIKAILGADSIYPSLTVADGVPVFVAKKDRERASAVVQNRGPRD